MNIVQATNAILSRRDCQRRVDHEQSILEAFETKRKEAQTRLTVAQKDLEAAILRERQAREQYEPKTWAKIEREASPVSGM